MRRVDEAVREVLSSSVADLKDPRIGFVTVTDVRTSPDLRHARVYVSVFGAGEEQTASITGLQSGHGYLQAQLARQLRMKHTPTLTFVLDDTAERASRVEELVSEEGGPS